MSEIREALKRLVDEMIPEGSFTGTVKAVKGDVCTISPDDGGPDYFKVRLKPSIDGDDKGIIIKPAKGSSVVVSPFGKKGGQYYVQQWSKVESIYIKTSKGVQLLFQDNGQLHLNGDSFGGNVKVQELTTELNKIQADLTVLKAALVALLPALASPTPPATPWEIQATGAFTAAFAAYGSTPLPLTKRLAIENLNVKHGSGN